MASSASSRTSTSTAVSALSTSVGTTDRYYALAYTVRDYPMARWLEDGRRQREVQRRRAFTGLSLRRVPARPAASTTILLATGLTSVAEGALIACGIVTSTNCARKRSSPASATAASWPPCGSRCIRLARDVGRAEHGVRHPLRVRHLPSDLRRRPAGRAARATGSPTARRGSSRTPRPRRPFRSAVTPRRTTTRVSRARAGSPRGACRRCPTTTRWCPATRTGASTPCACGARRRTNSFDLRGVQRRRPRRGLSRAQTYAENISKVLSPEDSTPQGKELRLQQRQSPLRGGIHHGLPRGDAAEGLRSDEAARPRDLPAERHPPGHRGARARRACSWTRGQAGVGGRVGDHPEVLRLHVPRVAARRPFEVWSTELLGQLLPPRHPGSSTASATTSWMPSPRALRRR